jgi:SAM-dependent methyltransferase
MQRFSEAAENNKNHILLVLRERLPPNARVLEIGSGSGQHALHMAAEMKSIIWQPTERSEGIPDLARNLSDYGSPNILGPLRLDLSSEAWPDTDTNCVYSANVMHIVNEPLGESLVRGAGKNLSEEGLFILYGPFKYAGDFTTQSNASFDAWLKERDPNSGIRDFEWVTDLANQHGLSLQADLSMPANNQMLIFQRRPRH